MQDVIRVPTIFASSIPKVKRYKSILKFLSFTEKYTDATGEGGFDVIYVCCKKQELVIISRTFNFRYRNDNIIGKQREYNSACYTGKL